MSETPNVSSQSVHLTFDNTIGRAAEGDPQRKVDLSEVVLFTTGSNRSTGNTNKKQVIRSLVAGQIKSLAANKVKNELQEHVKATLGKLANRFPRHIQKRINQNIETLANECANKVVEKLNNSNNTNRITTKNLYSGDLARANEALTDNIKNAKTLVLNSIRRDLRNTTDRVLEKRVYFRLQASHDFGPLASGARKGKASAPKPGGAIVYRSEQMKGANQNTNSHPGSVQNDARNDAKTIQKGSSEELKQKAEANEAFTREQLRSVLLEQRPSSSGLTDADLALLDSASGLDLSDILRNVERFPNLELATLLNRNAAQPTPVGVINLLLQINRGVQEGFSELEAQQTQAYVAKWIADKILETQGENFPKALRSSFREWAASAPEKFLIYVERLFGFTTRNSFRFAAENHPSAPPYSPTSDEAISEAFQNFILAACADLERNLIDKDNSRLTEFLGYMSRQYPAPQQRIQHPRRAWDEPFKDLIGRSPTENDGVDMGKPPPTIEEQQAARAERLSMLKIASFVYDQNPNEAGKRPLVAYLQPTTDHQDITYNPAFAQQAPITHEEYNALRAGLPQIFLRNINFYLDGLKPFDTHGRVREALREALTDNDDVKNLVKISQTGRRAMDNYRNEDIRGVDIKWQKDEQHVFSMLDSDLREELTPAEYENLHRIVFGEFGGIFRELFSNIPTDGVPTANNGRMSTGQFVFALYCKLARSIQRNYGHDEDFDNTKKQIRNIANDLAPGVMDSLGR